MSKPIFITRVPYQYFAGEREMFERTLKTLRKDLPDYHVLLCGDSTIESTQFECYNAGDVPEITIQEIQDKIFTTIETNELSDWDVTLMDGLEDE
jgi:hypothetical protein